MKNELKNTDSGRKHSERAAARQGRSGSILAPLGLLMAGFGVCMVITGSYQNVALEMEAQVYAGGSCVDISAGDDACDKASSYVAAWIGQDCLANENPVVRRQCGGEKSQGFVFSTTEWDVAGAAPVPCPGKEMTCRHKQIEPGQWGYRWEDTTTEGVCGYRDTFELSNARPNSPNCTTPTPTPAGGAK